MNSTVNNSIIFIFTKTQCLNDNSWEKYRSYIVNPVGTLSLFYLIIVFTKIKTQVLIMAISDLIWYPRVHYYLQKIIVYLEFSKVHSVIQNIKSCPQESVNNAIKNIQLKFHSLPILMTNWWIAVNVLMVKKPKIKYSSTKEIPNDHFSVVHCVSA